MKKAKQFLSRARELAPTESEELNKALWDLICYPPKMPVRLAQEQLLKEASEFSVSVSDPHFKKGELQVKGFKWGEGGQRVLLTHGWGSKAVDLLELITDLKNSGFEVIAFDAPGNGDSEGDLSNLLLFSKAIRAVIEKTGIPQVMIGHSMGAAANVLALKEAKTLIPVLISLAPMVNLKEHFISIMNNAGASAAAQQNFFTSFYSLFNTSPEVFAMKEMYAHVNPKWHLLFYSSDDKVAPPEFTEEFLASYPAVQGRKVENTSHEKIFKEPEVIKEIIDFIEHGNEEV